MKISKRGLLFSVKMIYKLIIAKIFQDLSTKRRLTVLQDNTAVSNHSHKRYFSIVADENCTSQYKFLQTN